MADADADVDLYTDLLPGPAPDADLGPTYEDVRCPFLPLALSPMRRSIERV